MSASFPQTDYFSGVISGPVVLCVHDSAGGYVAPVIGDVVAISGTTVVSYQPVRLWTDSYSATNPVPLGVVVWVRGGASTEILVQTSGRIPNSVTGIISGTGVWARVDPTTGRLGHSTTLDSRVVGSISTTHVITWSGKQPSVPEQVLMAGCVSDTSGGWVTIGAGTVTAGAWDLVAVLSTGADGVAASVRLVEAATGAVVDTVSTTALGIAQQALAVTLAADTLVLAQLSTGTAGVAATCYHVGLQQ